MTIIRDFVAGLTLAAALWLAVGAEAQAQGQTSTVVVTRVEPAPQDAATGRRLDLARDLIDLSAGPNFMKEFESAMNAQLAAIDQKGGEEAAWVRANMPPMLSRMIVRLMDEMVPAYAELYTEEELQGQIDFYRSPVGRSVASKAIPLGVALQEAQLEVMRTFLTELESKYCARFDCGDAAEGAAKPSRR